MFGFQVRNNNAAASPRAAASPSTAAVGEIDTKAPFESVKAAVTLFVEASPKADRPVLKKSRAIMEESVLGKETQLHWVLKEIDKYKEHVKTAESTKGQALEELKNSSKTLQELTSKLEAASKSKQASTESTKAAETRSEQQKSTKSHEAWQESVDNERNLYKAAANELIFVKQQLNNLKQDFDIALEAKLSSFQYATEAQHSAKLNHKKKNELAQDFDHMSQTLERVKLASAKAEEANVKLMEEKEALLASKKKAKDNIDLQISCRRKETMDLGNLVKKLQETTEAVNLLHEQLKGVRAADMELLRKSNSELEETKRTLSEMKEEETSLRGVVESLIQETENVRRDISVSKEEDLQSEQLQTKLDRIKLQVEESLTKETIAGNDVHELELKICEMSLEAERARHQEEEVKRQMETHWREAQRSELAIKAAEARLEIAQREVEEAEASKELADDQIRKRSSASTTDHMMDSNNDNTVILTSNDFETLSKKAEEATIAADTKVEAIMSQLETIKQKERGILEKLEKSMEENKEIESKITKAQKTAEEADAARLRVEIELNKTKGR
uniref:WEB family protein At1g12150-like n=1 Tax=Erigeron canadensis TaxID=72917 RepID=UPI001CB9C7DB|nr:WEB family protein At1g12150-like [Erigeron canadensis]